MHTWLRTAAAIALLASVAAGAWAQAPGRREGNLQVGDLAPDFTIQDLQATTTVRLSDLKGKPVALIFGSCT
jgi:hypothetical protein